MSCVHTEARSSILVFNKEESLKYIVDIIDYSGWPHLQVTIKGAQWLAKKQSGWPHLQVTTIKGAQWLAKKQKETQDTVPCMYSLYSRIKHRIF